MRRALTLVSALVFAGCVPEPAQPSPAEGARGAAAPPKPDAARAPVLRAAVPRPTMPPDAGPPPVPERPAPGVGGPDFAAVFAAVSPSVVAVSAGHLDADRRFVSDHAGTGFVWDAAGHVVTNAHVVGEAEQLRVRTLDGRVKRARLVGRDVPTDLAVLALDDLDLRAVHRGDVRALEPGQWVAAIGNPYGMQHSITVGVISAVGRRRLPPGGPKYADFIQTDLAINPGNSGGPLVDHRGRVVGLNTAVLGQGQGLSFATPVDMVATVAERLLAEGRFVRGFGGLFVRSVSPATAKKAGLERPAGARVSGLVEGGPAAAAGLQKNDIILRFGAEALDDAGALPWLIARTRPGTAVPLHVARGEARVDLTLTVGEVP